MKNPVILVTRYGMGTAKDLPTLPLMLIDKYLSLMLEGNSLPAAICFYTDGVLLSVKDSPVLDRLKMLEQKGVRPIFCSACPGAFGRTNDVRVGIVGGMPDILEAQIKAEKVITI